MRISRSTVFMVSRCEENEQTDSNKQSKVEERQ